MSARRLLPRCLRLRVGRRRRLRRARPLPTLARASVLARLAQSLRGIARRR